MLKFQTHLYAVNSVVTHLKCWKLRYSKMDVLAFRFPASSDLCLKLNSSVIPASYQASHGDVT
jgi:hypothetical protein